MYYCFNAWLDVYCGIRVKKNSTPSKPEWYVFCYTNANQTQSFYNSRKHMIRKLTEFFSSEGFQFIQSHFKLNNWRKPHTIWCVTHFWNESHKFRSQSQIVVLDITKDFDLRLFWINYQHLDFPQNCLYQNQLLRN